MNQSPIGKKASSAAALFLVACSFAAALPAQTDAPAVTVQVEIAGGGAHKAGASADNSNVAVWLVPLEGEARLASAGLPNGRPPQLIQRNKMFEPHVLVVQAGSVVEFPNKDPFFHNVFSLFDGKRFDLGLYEAGTSKSVRFDRVGVSYLFCNIHPEMTAVVVAVESPYFGLSDRDGRVAIHGVPDGRYRMRVFYERTRPEDLKSLERVVVISSSSRVLDPVRVTENPDFTLDHKNKFGQDYEPTNSTIY